MAFMLTGCSKVVEVQLQENVKAFQSKNKEIAIPLTSNDAAHIALNKWLKENKDGWFSTSGRYPGGVYILSGEQGIQITQQKVILYATDGEKPTAIYAQEIARSDLQEVKSIGLDTAKQ